MTLMRTGTIAAALLCVGMALSGPPALATLTPETTVAICQKQVETQAGVFAKGYLKALQTCLKKIDIEVVKNNEPNTDKAAATCVAQLRKINDSRNLGKSLAEKLVAKIDQKCVPGGANLHTLADILGPGASVAQPLDAANLGTWCEAYGATARSTRSPSGRTASWPRTSRAPTSS